MSEQLEKCTTSDMLLFPPLLQSDSDTKGFSSSCSESLPIFCLSGYDSPQEFQKLK